MNEKRLKILKFDGDCISTSENLLKSVRIVMSEKDFPIVVIPAFEGITDLLMDGIEHAGGKEVKVSETISVLTEMHYNIAQETIRNDKIFNRVIQEITIQIKKVERLLYGVAYTEEITDAVSAYILSYGERIAAIIFSGALEDNGCGSKIIETDRIGLVTDRNIETAIVNLDDFKRSFNFTAHSIVNNKVIPIFTGFFGSTPDGKVITFGRKGGDYTSSVLAYGFGASEVEIWKNGTAFMSADPDKVRNAKIIEKLSYFEAAELVYFGKRVLHPLTIEPAAVSEIPIYVKDILCPECRGTKIAQDAYIEENVIKSVSQNENISMLRIHGTGIGYKPGLIREFSDSLAAENINIFATVSSQTTINLIVENKDAEKSYEILNAYKGKVIEKIDFVRNIALVAIIGEGLVKKRGIFARILGAVSDQKVNVEMASAGASEVAIYIIVPKDELSEVVNAIHKEFFG